MPRKSNKRSSARRRPKRRRKAKGRGAKPRTFRTTLDSASLMKGCALVDPWCVTKARYPDESSTYTKLHSVVGRWTITTDGSGDQVFSAYPMFNNCIYTAQTHTGTTVSDRGTGTSDPGYNGIFQDADTARIISQGYKITAITSDDKSGGYVRVLLGSRPPLTPFDFLSTESQEELIVSIAELRVKPLYVVSDIMGGAARDFTSISSTTNSDWGRQSFTIGISGGEFTTAVLLVERTTNIEYTTYPGHLQGGVRSLDRPALRSAAANAAAGTSSFYSDVRDLGRDTYALVRDGVAGARAVADAYGGARNALSSMRSPLLLE